MAMARRLTVDAAPDFPEQMVYENDNPTITAGIQKYLDLCHEMAASELTVDHPEYLKLVGELDVVWDELPVEDQRVAQQLINQEIQAKQAAASIETKTSPEASAEPSTADTDAPPPPATDELEEAFASVDEELRGKSAEDSEDIEKDDPGDEEE